jgi:hypothetical protein
VEEEEPLQLRDLIADAGGNDIEIEFYYKGKLILQNQSIYDCFQKSSTQVAIPVRGSDGRYRVGY